MGNVTWLDATAAAVDHIVPERLALLAALYEIIIWDTLKFYAVIVPPERSR